MSQPTQKFTPIADSDLAAAVAELVAAVGEAEANKPSWIRRLVKLGTGELGLVVNSCVAIRRDDLSWKSPWTANGMATIAVAYPLSEAVAILKSDDSPEIEVERRQKLFAEFQAEKAKREEEKRKAEEAAAQRLAQDRLDEERFHARDWEANYSELGRTLLGLAVMVEGRDSRLCDDLRALARHQRVHLGGNVTNPLPYPRVQWDKPPSTSSCGWQWWLRNEPSKASV